MQTNHIRCHNRIGTRDDGGLRGDINCTMLKLSWAVGQQIFPGEEVSKKAHQLDRKTLQAEGRTGAKARKHTFACCV